MTTAIEPTGLPDKPTATDLYTWEKQEGFLQAYASQGGVYKSAAAGGCSARSVENWQDADTFAFQKRFDLAKEKYLEKLTTEADRRALDGVDQDIFYQRDKIGTKTTYSDNLLMFRMKKLDPSYRDNYSVVEDLSAIRESLDMLRQLGTPRLEPPKIVDGKSEIVDSLSETEEE